MRSFIRSYFVFRIRIRRINRPELSPWNVTPHLHHPFFGICMEKIFIFTRNSYSGVATPHIYFWLFFVLLCFVNSTHTHICIKLQKKKKKKEERMENFHSYCFSKLFHGSHFIYFHSSLCGCVHFTT